MNFDDLMFKQNYTFYRAVGQTKLALILFTKELSRRLEGRPITVNSLHPGVIRTNLMHQMPWIFRGLFRLLSASPKRGARTPVYLASSPEVRGISGQFFSNRKPTKTSATADDPNAAKELWDVSISLLKPGVLK